MFLAIGGPFRALKVCACVRDDFERPKVGAAEVVLHRCNNGGKGGISHFFQPEERRKAVNDNQEDFVAVGNCEGIDAEDLPWGFT